jgi:hypothetical protein
MARPLDEGYDDLFLSCCHCSSFTPYDTQSRSVVTDACHVLGSVLPVLWPTLLIFGHRDFSPLPDVVEMFELLPIT